MCGIAGLITAHRVSQSGLARMASVIAHRGPDDHGIWIDQETGVGLAHRRLSIVDLSPHGHQPMASSDGRFVISYNGEIYNHLEIRAELSAHNRGPHGGWRGHSDTETLIEAIAAFGLEGALGLAVGMFAFALWDKKDRRLHLVRDRFGEKPLYYGWAGNDFVFGSELKAARVHPQFNGEIDRRALELFAGRGYIPAPHTIYRNMFKLLPGCILTVDPAAGLTATSSAPQVEVRAGGLCLKRYYSYRAVVREGLADPIAGDEAALEQLERTLGAAVRGQSVADVPVGAFLSGGIDSSIIVALYQKYSARSVRTFSIGFDQAGYDEAAHAKKVAAHLGTEHHELYVSAEDAREVIPKLPSMYDEPFADSSQIPTFLVSRFARSNVTVALTGDGGDELFGGYNRHVIAPRLWGKLSHIPRPLRALAAGTLARIPASAWSGASRFVGGAPAGVGAKMQKALRIAAEAQSIDDVYHGFLDEWDGETNPARSGGAMSGFDLDLGPGAPDALRLMYSDAVSYLPDDILCKVDRASMAVSLETRVPFLDHRVAALAARIPTNLKIRGSTGKHIVRELLYREAPRALFDRPKAGFAMPVGDWLKGSLRDWAEDLLDPARMATEGWLDPVSVQRRWCQHLTGARDSTPAIWSILMFQAWLRAESESLAVAA